MATANTWQTRERQPTRWLRNLALALLVLAVFAAAFFWSRMRETALARTAEAAQTGCLCRYASGRSLAACSADPAVVKPWVGLSEDAPARTIVASVPTLATQRAQWSEQTGCLLEPWQG